MDSRTIALGVLAAALAGCTTAGTPTTTKQAFNDDVAFLQKHTNVVILMDKSGQGRVAVLPKMQGRVMTSTAAGPNGYSFGWINREFVAAGKPDPHMNAYGGEDRFWLGPEGGQFSIFFDKGRPVRHGPLAHAGPGRYGGLGPGRPRPGRRRCSAQDMQVKNYSGTVFDLRVEREVRVLEREAAASSCLAVTAGSDVKMVAYESNNKVTNLGKEPWTKETGLLSIWILGMFNPSPEITIVVPYVAGPEDQLGPVANDSYFGKVPAERLVNKDGVLYFSGDGKYRSKIGLSPKRAKTVLGSYDAVNGVLTIVQYNKPEGVEDYVNSMWQIQDQPYPRRRGQLLQRWPDLARRQAARARSTSWRPPRPRRPWRRARAFSTPIARFHFAGSEAQLDPIAKATLGVTIAQIKSALR